MSNAAPPVASPVPLPTPPATSPAVIPPATAPAAPPSAVEPPRRLALVAGVASAAALAGLGLSWWRGQRAGRGADNSNSQTLPADAPALAALWALQVAQPQGGVLHLASLRGKPLLINFWATWCAPCVREMPELDRFYREFGPRGWQVLGLAIDGPMPVRAFLARVKVGFLIGLAGLDGTDLMHGLGNPSGGLPFSVLIGADGRLFRRKLGETRFNELASWAADA